MDVRTRKKIVGLAVFALMYAAAYALGFWAATAVQGTVLKLLVFDLTATVAIYLMSLPIKNSSLYDAYWSLTPLVMLAYLLIFGEGLNFYHFALAAALGLWGVRLTVNWAVTFEDMSWVDWRYRDIRDNTNAFVWQIANFFGIMLMPTLLVFAGFLPVIYAFQSSLNALSLAGTAIILAGTALELFADRQMHAFLRTAPKGQVICCGLWKYSRHPNYLGEILIWVGAYFALFPAVPECWHMFGGALLMILLFNFVSIPMAEKRQLKRREGYREYMQRTSRLLLLPPRRAKPAAEN